MKINWIIALRPEAQPLIDFFKLDKDPSDATKKGKLFSNASMRLAISGIGRQSSAIATAMLFESSAHTKNDIWINFGIAGHINLAIGSLIQAETISYQHGRPLELVAHSFFDTHVVETVDQPQHDYPNLNVIEMEAYGFAQTLLTRGVSKDKILTLKLISDNQKHPITEIKKEDIAPLISKKIPTLKQGIEKIFNIVLESPI